MAEERSDVNGIEDGADENAETDQIKEQIEETRSHMGVTIDAIQDKLSFSNVSEQVSEHVNHAVDAAKDAVYGATIGKAVTFMKDLGREVSGSTVVKTIGKNPLPFVLIGAGAGMLAYQSYNRKNERDTDFGRDYRYKGGRDMGRDDSERSSGMLSTAGDKVSGIAGKLTDKAGSAYGKLSEAAGSAYEEAGQTVGMAYDKIGQLGTAASDQYHMHIEENPLAVGAVALALGAAVGLAIPSTRYEGKLLGGTKQKLMDKAEEAASGLIDKTKEAVANVSESVSDQLNSETAH